MAFHTEKEGFPPIDLLSGMQIQLEAIDPTTGAAVSGVVADRWFIYGDDDSDPVLPPDPPVDWVNIPMGD